VSAVAIILMDTYEDGYCEETGWVETTVSEDEARDQLAEFCFDEEGETPHRPEGEPAVKVWLQPDPADTTPYEDEKCWIKCGSHDPGSLEFWEIKVV
jgi:hypothetical protein